MSVRIDGPHAWSGSVADHLREVMMADSTQSAQDRADRFDREKPPPPPRWVWLFGVIVAALIVLFVVLHLTGRGLGSHMHR